MKDFEIYISIYFITRCSLLLNGANNKEENDNPK
jgi:hypothetical protein